MKEQTKITFDDLISLLRKRLGQSLPGKDEQNKMAPSYRYDYASKQSKPIESSVLLLFYEEDKTVYLTFIKRSAEMRNHSGQISFPGGKCDKTDDSAMATALRETQEELGIDTRQIQVLGSLTALYIPVSNFMVHPFVGYTSIPPKFTPNPSEVAEVIAFPVQEFFNEKTVMEESWEKNDKLFVRPFFSFQGHKIWGATAMIMNELKALIVSSKKSTKTC